MYMCIYTLNKFGIKFSIQIQKLATFLVEVPRWWNKYNAPA